MNFQLSCFDSRKMVSTVAMAKLYSFMLQEEAKFSTEPTQCARNGVLVLYVRGLVVVIA